VGLRFNPPPGWPPPPRDFVPQPGWQPDPSWPPPPPGWRLWVDDQQVPAQDEVPRAAGPGAPYDPAGQPSASGKMSRWAIASFVLGLLSIVLLGIIFGVIALGRIKMLGQRGRGLAIAGLALSGAWIVLGITLLVLVHLTSATRSPTTGEITHSGHLSAFSLAVGDCFNNPPGATSVGFVTAIPCNQAHNAQIFAKFNLSGSILSYPGNTALARLATNGCNARVSILDKPKITDSMSIRFLFPVQKSWLDGHRTVSCMIANPTANITSSVLSP
jgi:hypothetical protein